MSEKDLGSLFLVGTEAEWGLSHTREKRQAFRSIAPISEDAQEPPLSCKGDACTGIIVGKTISLKKFAFMVHWSTRLCENRASRERL